MAAYPSPDEIDSVPAAINRLFPLKGRPRLFGLYDVQPYDGVAPQPTDDELIGVGLEFADRAITWILADEHGPMALGIHAQAQDAAALLSTVRPIRVRYVK